MIRLASILGMLNIEIEKFMMTIYEYREKKVIPDRYGDIFLSFKKVDNYYNKE
jgi:HEPN domain-containing protein